MHIKINILRLKLYESTKKILKVQELPSNDNINYDFEDDINQELNKKERNGESKVPIEIKSEVNANQMVFSEIILLPDEQMIRKGMETIRIQSKYNQYSDKLVELTKFSLQSTI